MATRPRKTTASQPVLAAAAAVPPGAGEVVPAGQTPNLGLAKPVNDDTNWGDEYRAAMETLDAHPGIRAFAEGQRPATPFGGQVILEQTDPPRLLAYSEATGEWDETAGQAASGGYTHVQTVKATTWTVVHNLGIVPGGFFVRDDEGGIQDPDIAANTTSATVLVFTEPRAGTASIS